MSSLFTFLVVMTITSPLKLSFAVNYAGMKTPSNLNVNQKMLEKPELGFCTIRGFTLQRRFPVFNVG